MNKPYPSDREQQRIVMRELMINVYEDTVLTIKNDDQLKASVRKSIESQQFYGEEDSIALPKPTFLERADLRVSLLRSFEAAAQYQERKVAVLNFACAVYPGGGVTIGFTGQEESLCRVSTLSFCLDNPKAWDKYYTPNRKLLTYFIMMASSILRI